MVEITPFSLQNVTLHYEWNNDAELAYYDSEYPHEHEPFDTFLRRIKSVLDSDNDTAELFEIHLKDTGQLIGIVDLHAIDRYNRRCYVNCTIGDRDYAGEGYDEQALKLILAYCFEELEMHKVGTTAFDFNTTWIDHVQEIGFSLEGTLRKHVLKNDTWRDKLIFSLLKEEYRKTGSINGQARVA